MTTQQCPNCSVGLALGISGFVEITDIAYCPLHQAAAETKASHDRLLKAAEDALASRETDAMTHDGRILATVSKKAIVALMAAIAKAHGEVAPETPRT